MSVAVRCFDMIFRMYHTPDIMYSTGTDILYVFKRTWEVSLCCEALQRQPAGRWCCCFCRRCRERRAAVVWVGGAWPRQGGGAGAETAAGNPLRGGRGSGSLGLSSADRT